MLVKYINKSNYAKKGKVSYCLIDLLIHKYVNKLPTSALTVALAQSV